MERHYIVGAIPSPWPKLPRIEMNGTELRSARKGMGLSQPAFARAVNAWWADQDGAPASYDQPRISNLERAEKIPVKIQWFIADAN